MWLFMLVASLIQHSANSEELVRNRHLNSAGFMNISEIIDYWGYPSERYEIMTADDYYLEVNRIPYGLHSPRKAGPRPAVLLVHGGLCEGRMWIANLPNNSLGFFLADVDYDVWILNCRGTTWSRRHKYLSIDQQQFWDFSFHEMGIYDVPATIDFILQKTKQDALYYIGHSQGAAIGYIAFSILPQLAQKVKLFMNFAPVYSLVGTTGPVRLLLSVPEKLAAVIWGTKELRILTPHMKDIYSKFCSYERAEQFCIQVIITSVGFSANLNVSRTEVYAALFPDYISMKTGNHWKQVLKTKQFKYFDYGSRNKDVYNKTTPPFYKIEDMIVPTAVWYGKNDILATKANVEQLLSRIPHLVFQKYMRAWAHADYMLGLDAPEYLYPDMLYLMQQYK